MKMTHLADAMRRRERTQRVYVLLGAIQSTVDAPWQTDTEARAAIREAIATYEQVQREDAP